MKKVFTLLFIAAVAQTTRAQQVPGYLGKKWTFAYELSLSPSFANPTSAEYTFKDDFFDYYDLDFSKGLGYKHYLKADYAASKSTSYGARLGYFGSYYGSTLITLSPDLGSSFRPTLIEFGKMASYSLGLNLKRFTQHYAPLGKYFEFGFDYHLVTYSDLIFALNESNPNNNDLIRNVPGGFSSNLGIHFGQGVNRVIADKYLISFGYELGFMIQGIEKSNNLFTAYTSGPENAGGRLSASDAALQELMIEDANGRLFAQAMINLKISVGILY